MLNLKVPNQLNIKNRGKFLFYENIYTLLKSYSNYEFDKNANSINLSVLIALYIELVW